MSSQEILDAVQRFVAPLREELGVDDESLGELSQKLRAIYVNRPEAKKTDPRELGILTEVIDEAVTPIFAAAKIICLRNPRLSKKFLGEDDSAVEQNLVKLIVACGDEADLSGEINMAKIEKLMDMIASKEE